MGFVFRLERLLSLREREEKTRAGDLAQALQAEVQLRQALEAATERLSRASQEMGRRTGRVTPVGTLRNLALTVEAAARNVDEAEVSHHQAVAGREAEQERFVAARKDRRAVERLREIRSEVWHHEAGRKEQHETDEIAGQRHRRRETK